MSFKTPSSWYRAPGSPAPLSELAAIPLSWLYRIGYEFHQMSGRHEVFDIPVVCVGNINAGGTGKTPTALALMQLIKDQGIARHPYYLSRGYGGTEIGPMLVDLQKDTAANMGDEPVTLAALAPTIVAGNRARGIMLAIEKKADLVLMDDGLQNPHIEKDVSFVTINGEMGFGNGRLLPAGPLREPLKKGLEKADAFIIIGEDKRNARSLLPADKPVFTASLTPVNGIAPGQRYLAFAGIGYPEKFFSFLRNTLRADVVGGIAYPDHHPYTEGDLAGLAEKAADLDARLITTEKDSLRLPGGMNVDVLKIALAWDDSTPVADFLKARIAA